MSARAKPGRAGGAAATGNVTSEQPEVTRAMVDLSELRPHPRNYNRHPAKQVERIGQSLGKFGQVRSIVVWRKTTLAGHGVVKGARLIGWTQIRADVLPDDYPEELALAYVAADNELSRMAEPDEAQLAAILEESAAYDPELLAAIGYDDQELAELLARLEANRRTQTTGDPEPQIERAAELQAEHRTATGQLWQLGDHRLLIADATQPAAWARLMDKKRADLLWTDPPYGVSYADKNKFLNAIARGNRIEEEIENDHGSVGESAALWLSVFRQARQNSRPGAGYYVTSPQGGELMMMMMMMRDAGWAIKHTLVWVKNHFVLGRSDYHYKHEPILYGWAPGAGHTWIDDFPACSVIDDDPDIKRMSKEQLIDLVNDLQNAQRTDVLRIDKPSTSDLHPTTKPTALVRLTMQNSTNAGDLVVDPFAGSGTTLIACQQLNRRARVMEISPNYAAVVIQRYIDATGDTPRLLEPNA